MRGGAKPGKQGLQIGNGEMKAGRFLVTLAIVAAATAALSACGRRAPLDTPYQAAVDARKQAREDGTPLPPEPQKPERDKPFVLDRLIE